jgi:hypothetical protein
VVVSPSICVFSPEPHVQHHSSFSPTDLSTRHISALLRFHFWQPVYFKLSEPSFPSESKEALGHVVGISEHCGHALTYKILSSESDVIIYRSLLRPATSDDGNVRACMSGGETHTHIPTGPLKD